jgi:hypothetical protein
MAYQIRTYGDPVLKSKASEVSDINGKIARLVDDMFDNNAGLVYMSVTSSSIIDTLLPPRAAEWADTGIFRNSYPILPS